MDGTVRAICISEKRGTVKREVEAARFIENHGIEGDAHAGDWHRQVSLLSADKVDAFNEKGALVISGDFGENLVIEGIDCASLPAGTTVIIGEGDDEVRLSVTQRGKECHTHCQVYQRMGDCIMPREGIFTRVMKGGTVKKGSPVRVVMPDKERPFTAAIVILSDKASMGIREDKSGPKAASVLKDAGYDVLETVVIPDEKDRLRNELIRLSDGREADLIITSGGTGFSVRDITPEVTLEVAHRNAPGIAEYMRLKSMEITDRAMLSRGASVIRGHSVIVNLPGSPKAVEECLSFILDALAHGIGVLRGSVSECAGNEE